MNADRLVASFLGLMAETMSDCDCCGRRVPRREIGTVRASWHDECNACATCRGEKP